MELSVKQNTLDNIKHSQVLGESFIHLVSLHSLKLLNSSDFLNVIHDLVYAVTPFCTSISFARLFPSLPIYKHLCCCVAEGSVGRSVRAGAVQAAVRRAVAPGDGQVSATAEGLRGLAAVEGGRRPRKAAPRQKALAHAAERRAAPEVNARHANRVTRASDLTESEANRNCGVQHSDAEREAPG